MIESGASHSFQPKFLDRVFLSNDPVLQNSGTLENENLGYNL